MAQIIALVGLPGSGKTSQAQVIADRHGWKLVSMGQLLRSRRPNLTSRLSAGDLVDSSAAEAMWEEIFSEIPKDQNIIMDSFPRLIGEAQWFFERLSTWGRSFGGVFKLEVSEEEAVRRLVERGRMDDSEKSLRHRFELYEVATKPVLDYCRSIGRLVAVDGVGTVEEVNRRLEEAIFNHKKLGEQ